MESRRRRRLLLQQSHSASINSVDNEPHDEKHFIQKTNLISPSSTTEIHLLRGKSLPISSHRHHRGDDQDDTTSHLRLVSPSTEDSPSNLYSTDLKNKSSIPNLTRAKSNSEIESSSYLDNFHHDLSNSIDQSIQQPNQSSSDQQGNGYNENISKYDISPPRRKWVGKTDNDDPFDIESTDSSLRKKNMPRKGGNKPFDEINYDVDTANHLNLSLMRQKQRQHQSTYSTNKNAITDARDQNLKEEEIYERMFRSDSEDEGDNGRKGVKSLPPIHLNSPVENRKNAFKKKSFRNKRQIKGPVSSFDTNSSYEKGDEMTSYNSYDVYMENKSLDNDYNDVSVGVDTSDTDSRIGHDLKNYPTYLDRNKPSEREQCRSPDFGSRTDRSSYNLGVRVTNKTKDEETEAEPALFNYGDLVRNNLDEVQDPRKFNQYTRMSTAGGWTKNDRDIDSLSEAYNENDSWDEAEEQWKQAEEENKQFHYFDATQDETSKMSFEENSLLRTANEEHAKRIDSKIPGAHYHFGHGKTSRDSIGDFTMDEPHSTVTNKSLEIKLKTSIVSETCSKTDNTDDESLLNLSSEALPVGGKKDHQVTKDAERPKARKKRSKRRKKRSSESKEGKTNLKENPGKSEDETSHEENNNVRKESKTKTKTKNHDVNMEAISSLKKEFKYQSHNSGHEKETNEKRISSKVKLKGKNLLEAKRGKGSVAFADANQNTIHEFDATSTRTDDDASEIASVTDASEITSVCDSYDGRSMHSEYTKSYESEAEDMMKDFFFIGSGKSTNPGKRQLKYRHDRKKIYRQRKAKQKKKKKNNRESNNTINIVNNVINDSVSDSETETEINLHNRNNESGYTSKKSLENRSSHSKPHSSSSHENEFDIPDPLSYVWSYVEDGLNAVNSVLGFSDSPDAEQEGTSARNTTPPKKSMMDFTSRFVDENGQLNCQEYDAGNSVGALQGEPKGKNGNFETDNELANGLYKAAVCSAENKHFLLGLSYDRTADIDVVKEIKFVMVAIRFPIGISFQENSAGCWVSTFDDQGNAAKNCGDNKVESGDQLASINGENALGMNRSELDALLSNAAKRKVIEMTFLRYVGGLKTKNLISPKFEMKNDDPTPTSPMKKSKSWALPRKAKNTSSPTSEYLEDSQGMTSGSEGKAPKSKRKFSLFRRGKKNKKKVPG